MAIKVPGRRNKHGRAGGGKRSAVVALNMTAMVDMFTVLCVFLLQNYATTNQVLPMPDKVQLPSAHETKELKPSNVVIVGDDGILLNNIKVADFAQVKAQEDVIVKPLQELLEKSVQEGRANRQSIGNQLKAAVNDGQKPGGATEDVQDFEKITIQADKTIDFKTVKKIMYTVTEAGMKEINFAVLKKRKETM